MNRITKIIEEKIVYIVAVGLALGFALIALGMYGHASGSISADTSAISDKYRLYDLMASTTAATTVATTTTATSTNITAYFDSSGRRIDGSVDMRGAKKVAFYFSQGGISHANTGTSTFYVQTSRDGTNWDYYNMLIANAATSSNGYRVGSVQLPTVISLAPGTSTVVYWMDPTTLSFQYARCVAVLSGTSEQSCAAAVQY